MRGAATASAMFMPRSITLTMTCSTAVMMRLPPGEPVTRNGLPSLSTIVGVIDDSGRLPGPGALASKSDEAEGVRRIRLGGEIVEFVVEQNAGAVGDQTDAVKEIERVGVGHRVAEAGRPRRSAWYCGLPA